MKQFIYIFVFVLTFLIKANAQLQPPSVGIYVSANGEIQNKTVLIPILDGVAGGFMDCHLNVRNNTEWLDAAGTPTDAIYLEQEIEQILNSFTTNNGISRRNQRQLKEFQATKQIKLIALVQVLHNPNKAAEEEYTLIVRIFDIEKLEYQAPPEHHYLNKRNLGRPEVIRNLVRLYLLKNGFAYNEPTLPRDSVELLKEQIGLVWQLGYVMPNDSLVKVVIREIKSNRYTYQIYLNYEYRYCYERLNSINPENFQAHVYMLWMDKIIDASEKLEKINTNPVVRRKYYNHKQMYKQQKKELQKALDSR